MSAATLNLQIEQGTTYRQELQWFNPDGTTAIDLTGCTALAHVRTAIDATETLLELSTENGRIEITPLEGKILLHLTAEETAALSWSIGLYDLEIIFPTTGDEIPIYRLCKGKIKVIKEITRQ
jgi:hypothetical protein